MQIINQSTHTHKHEGRHTDILKGLCRGGEGELSYIHKNAHIRSIFKIGAFKNLCVHTYIALKK